MAGGRPIGLIHRNEFISQYVRPYQREIYGKRSCTEFMDTNPLVVERTMPIHDLSERLTDLDSRHLSEGFIITSNGSYLDLGTGKDLIRGDHHPPTRVGSTCQSADHAACKCPHR